METYGVVQQNGDLEEEEITLSQDVTEGQQGSLKDDPESIDAHHKICAFFIEQVQTDSSENVLSQFQGLFLAQATNLIPQSVCNALYEIVGLNQQKQFILTLKRACYILINNWSAAREINAIQKLVYLLGKTDNFHKTSSLIKKRLHQWLLNFIASQDYKDLERFIYQLNPMNKMEDCWSDRYAYYQLASQYYDAEQPLEKREAAKIMSRQLKDKFKFELAMYTAHACKKDENFQNPTMLGDNVLRLIQKILSRKGSFSHENLARIFLKQTEGIKYCDFKKSLVKYLVFSLGNEPCIEMLKQEINQHLDGIYNQYDQQKVDSHLLLRTCNRLIECLTQAQGEPSYGFKLLAMQEKSLTLVVLLLKIILVCKHSYIHLESCIADLVKYYENEQESECKWFIIFLETLKVTLTIYDENIEFNLVRTKNNQGSKKIRVFSQVKHRSEAIQAFALPVAN